MADDVHECAKLGATVFHIHSRDENQKPTMRVDVFRETCRLIKERDPEVIIQISTGGRAPNIPGWDLTAKPLKNWRIDPLNLLPEMGSFTPGSCNLNPIVYANSEELCQDLAKKYHDTGIKPQIEVFDSMMITNAYNLVKQGLLKRPLDFGFVMGAPGSQAMTLQQVGHLASMLQPGDTWTSIGIGKFEMPLAYMAICMGGHVRVGLEDTNKLPDGKLATNVELVKHVVDMAAMMGREIANPAESRKILSMPEEYKDRICPQLKAPLTDLVSEIAVYEAFGKVVIGEDFAEVVPVAKPDPTKVSFAESGYATKAEYCAAIMASQ